MTTSYVASTADEARWRSAPCQIKTLRAPGRVCAEIYVSYVICMYVCVCTYVQIHVHMYTQTYTYVHIMYTMYTSCAHCVIADTGATTREPPRGLSCVRAARHAAVAADCWSISAMVCMVLPMPISSASTPPRTFTYYISYVKCNLYVCSYMYVKWSCPCPFHPQVRRRGLSHITYHMLYMPISLLYMPRTEEVAASCPLIHARPSS